MSKMHYFSNKF